MKFLRKKNFLAFTLFTWNNILQEETKWVILLAIEQAAQ